MASFGRLRLKLDKVDGNGKLVPASGASVEVRRQGASVSGAQSGTPLNLDAINGILVGDTIVRNASSSPTKVATAITATTIDLSGGGFVSVSDDDRLSIISGLPTLYVDAQGNETTPNPGTTDANGMFVAYSLGGLYDILTSGGGTTTTLHQDVGTEGAESLRSNAFTTGSLTVYSFDTLRSMAVGDTLLALKNAGTNEFRVQGDGEIIAGTAGATHNLTGTLTASSTITATAGGIVATAGGVTATAGGVTATAGGVTATTGNIEATAGDLVYRRHLATKGTALVGGDWTPSAGWGDTAIITSVTGKDSRGRIQILCNGAGIGANPTLTLTFKDGAYAVAPQLVSSRGDIVAPAGGYWAGGIPTTTQAGWTFVGLPVAGNTYVLQYAVIG